MNHFLELREAVVNSSTSLPDALRKAKLLAYELGHEPLKQWVTNELNGYSNLEDVPDYRRLNVPSLGTFVGPYQGRVSNQIIPASFLPDDMKEMAEKLVLSNGVGEVEEMAKSEKLLRRPWPPEAVMLAREDVQMSGGYVLAEAYQPLQRSMLQGILEAVRNRLLEFVMELGQAHPQLTSDAEEVPQIPNEEISQLFNLTIHGDHNVVASGRSVSQRVSQEIVRDDLPALLQVLRAYGLREEDLESLQAAMQEDGRPPEGQLGPAVRAWLGTLVANISSGAWQATVEAAPMLIAKAVSKYYGWE